MRRLAPLALLLPLAVLAAGCYTSKPGRKIVTPTPTKIVGKVATVKTAAVPAQYKNGDTTAGKHVFLTAGCASCHTLKDAGATGTVGPNLDDLKPPLSRVVPQVINGGATMPAFKATLSTKQIADVAAYVVKATGGNPSG